MPKRTCIIEGCERPSRSRRMCVTHYEKWRRYGDALGQPLTPEQRFWQFVNKARPDGCWEWTGARRPTGYGEFRGRSKSGVSRSVRAHRFAYETFVGPIPPGMHVLHSCDHPWCVNPAHLWLGTHADNMADMDAKGRRRSPGHRKGVRYGATLLNSLKTHCPQGHEYSEANTYVAKSGSRHCRRCGREANRRRRSTP